MPRFVTNLTTQIIPTTPASKGEIHRPQVQEPSVNRPQKQHRSSHDEAVVERTGQHQPVDSYLPARRTDSSAPEVLYDQASDALEVLDDEEARSSGLVLSEYGHFFVNPDALQRDEADRRFHQSPWRRKGDEPEKEPGMRLSIKA